MICGICCEEKDNIFFSFSNKKKGSLKSSCKECDKKYRKEYYKKNKEKVLLKNKDWAIKNKKKYEEGHKKYYQKNKEKIKERSKRWQNESAKAKTYLKKIKMVEKDCFEDNGLLVVKCSLCKKNMIPTNSQAQRRLYVLNVFGQGESRFYCSTECKLKCPVFQQHEHRKKEKPEQKRETSKEFDKIVFEERNNECEKCGSKEKLQIHHIKGYTQYPELRFDLNNVLLLCKECHKKAHSQDGCTATNYQCKNNI